MAKTAIVFNDMKKIPFLNHGHFNRLWRLKLNNSLSFVSLLVVLTRMSWIEIMIVDDEFDDEFINAKSYFSTMQEDQEESLFNKLCDILAKLLTERPSDVVGSFLKLCQIKLGSKIEEAIPDWQRSVPPSCEAVKSVRQLFKAEFLDPEDKNANDLEVDFPNLMEECHNWEGAGIGLRRDEYFILLVSMKLLLENNASICSIRLWGKIFGLMKNYYVLECEIKDEDGEVEKENEEEEEEDTNEVTFEMDKIPKPKYEKPIKVPKEEEGKGANKNVYFVCNELGQEWKRLPSVHPIHITSARKIKKFFTGNLDSKVDSTPPFPGTEAYYLRAQIARITAGTQISPVGGYVIDEDDDTAEDSLENQQVVLNSEFDMPAARELEDISNWVHHVRYILPQGRTTWWSVSKVDEIEETEEQEEPKDDPEVGPPLLTPLSEDATLNEVVPWITRLSSKFISHHAFTTIHSCLWWGAHAYATSRSFENIYIGWGLKTTHNHYISGDPMQEFQDSEEIAEIDDPTPQQERAANEDFETVENTTEKKENEETERMQDDEEEEEEDD